MDVIGGIDDGRAVEERCGSNCALSRCDPDAEGSLPTSPA